MSRGPHLPPSWSDGVALTAADNVLLRHLPNRWRFPFAIQPTGQIHDACCDYETVESVNHDLFGRLHQLVETPYFRYHKVRIPSHPVSLERVL